VSRTSPPAPPGTTPRVVPLSSRSSTAAERADALAPDPDPSHAHHLPHPASGRRLAALGLTALAVTSGDALAATAGDLGPRLRRRRKAVLPFNLLPGDVLPTNAGKGADHRHGERDHRAPQRRRLVRSRFRRRRVVTDIMDTCAQLSLDTGYVDCAASSPVDAYFIVRDPRSQIWSRPHYVAVSGCRCY
jgi:hypothetical protein